MLASAVLPRRKSLTLLSGFYINVNQGFSGIAGAACPKQSSKSKDAFLLYEALLITVLKYQQRHQTQTTNTGH
jgi:hypothetical protein